MGVKHEIRKPKYETIWIHTLLRKESLGLTGVWKFKILNFQNRDFGCDGPKSELLKKQPSIIRAICVFDAKKVVPGMKTGELSRCQKRSKKNFGILDFCL